MHDNRDAMHKRGWTCFRVTGQLGGRSVSGAGRLPFVYASARKQYPWLKIRVGRHATFVDTPTGARVYDGQGLIAAQFKGGSFFMGLPRPWLGLHCIDAIRRDAAEQRLSFETTYDRKTDRAKVTVYARRLTLLYTVDMETDVVETINFFSERAGEPTELGELEFIYLQEVPDAMDPMFTPPANIRLGSARRQHVGLLWLEQLIASQ